MVVMVELVDTLDCESRSLWVQVPLITLLLGLIAQMVEHGSEVPSVGGSIPSQSINRGLLAQLVRALGS